MEGKRKEKRKGREKMKKEKKEEKGKWEEWMEEKKEKEEEFRERLKLIFEIVEEIKRGILCEWVESIVLKSEDEFLEFVRGVVCDLEGLEVKNKLYEYLDKFKY